MVITKKDVNKIKETLILSHMIISKYADVMNQKEYRESCKEIKECYTREIKQCLKLMNQLDNLYFHCSSIEYDMDDDNICSIDII